MKRIFWVFAAICCLSLVGVIGLSAVNKDRYKELQMFTKVLNLVERHYVENVDTKKLIYGGIKGMLAALEPHTNFLPPKIFKDFKVETKGKFGGIGIEITVKQEVLTVITPIEDTPAWRAGIKSGDRIVKINGESTKGMSLAEAVSKMRGKTGSKVKVSVWRDGLEKPEDMELRRSVIKIRAVKSTDLGKKFLYVRVTSFIESTTQSFKKALAKFEKKNGKAKGVILDLRNNAGGLLTQAINLSNQFISEGVIVSTRGRGNEATEEGTVRAKAKGSRLDFPMVVLINEYSASASEIVAGALQDHKRAVLMGRRSFGKGSVQSVIELGEGAGLKMTVARYFTPSGRSIQATGIEPDIVLEEVDSEAFEKAKVKKTVYRESDMKGHLANTDSFWKDKEKKKPKSEEKLSPKERLLKKDYQVAQALKYLKSWTLFKNLEGTPKAQLPKSAKNDL